MGISKSSFMNGLQCEKLLWLMKNKIEKRIVSDELQNKFDAGTTFGERARSLFGDYLDVTTYIEGSNKLDYGAMKIKTQEAIMQGKNIICEASFSTPSYDFCSVDILRKVDDGYEIYEVKNSLELTDTLIKDIAFQDYILFICKIKVKKCFIIHNSGNEEDPFKIEDVTYKAKNFAIKNVKENLSKFRRLVKQKQEVMVDMGEQCDKPYECTFKDYCKELALSN